MFEEIDGGQDTQNYLDKENGEISGFVDNQEPQQEQSFK